MQTHSARLPGTLYVVATPIGNLEDISPRARQTLELVDVILAEDTRHSRQLLNHFGIKKPMLSLHDHNEAERTATVLKDIQDGKSFALISDAGTPLISDPGFVLIREARQLDIHIVPIPGPSALITALSVAGVPCAQFFFAGFLPAKKNSRKEKLEILHNEGHTTVVYESSHRVLESLKDIGEIFGKEYQLVLAKELTKSFEHIITGSAEELITWLLEDAGHTKGEFVFILPASQAQSLEIEKDRAEDERVLKVLLAELPVKQAVRIAASLSSTPKNALYAMALKL